MGPTAEAWLQRTSSVSISKLGTDSAPAPSASTRLRLVWKALVPRASFRTRMSPEYTDLAVPATKAVPVYDIQVEGDDVMVKIS